MEQLQKHLLQVNRWENIPEGHIQYLYNLKSSGFEPKVIYDIGACVLHWTKVARTLWPEADIILFDAFANAEFLYKEHKYHIGCLSDDDDNVVKFYQNDYLPGGNSYYREIGCENGKYFPEDRYVEMKTKTLDTVVNQRGFPLPDFVKIDVQGAELDILKGGITTIGNAERMIVELQHVEYNQGAKLANESLPIIESMGWKCSDPLFQNNGPDGDYGFVRNNV
jgi:FkbM family methyltransferase